LHTAAVVAALFGLSKVGVLFLNLFLKCFFFRRCPFSSVERVDYIYYGLRGNAAALWRLHTSAVVAELFGLSKVGVLFLCFLFR
jgi:hypothetical protein